jgi:N-acetylneuraminate lyase
MAKIDGLVAAPFTPMDARGAVDVSVVPAYATLLRRQGVAGSFICGTTGEGMSLTTAERKALTEAWVAAGDGFRVLIHVGAGSPADACALAAHAEAHGAAGIATMGPTFFKPRTPAELAAYCRDLAAAAPKTPFYFYNMPSMTGITFALIDLFPLLAEIPTFAGAKYTFENLMDYEQCRRYDGGRYDVLFGRDEMLLPALALGTRGAVGSTYNFAGRLYVDLIRAWDAGDLAAAREAQWRSIQMIRRIGQCPCGFLPAAKALMGRLGVPCGAMRAPMPPCPAEVLDALVADLTPLDVLASAHLLQ